MAADVQIENVSAIQRRLRVTVPGDKVRSELDRAFRDLGLRVRLPGFRPGHVPRDLLEARYGTQVRGEVGAKIIQEVYRDASKGMEVAGEARIEERGELRGGTPFSFTLALEVRPEITVSNYTGIKVASQQRTVTDEDVDRAIRQRLASQAKIVEVAEDRAVVEGDFALAELILMKDGAEILHEPGVMLNTRAERYYPGVETLAIGLKRGESRAGTVTIGDGTVLEDVKGGTFEATVKVQQIQAHEVPALTDDVAKELGFADGADAMRAALRKGIELRFREQEKMQARANMLTSLVEAHTFDVPGAMVDEQLEGLQEEVRIRRASSGQDPRRVQFSEAEQANLRSRAIFAAKASCILVQVSKQEGIAVTHADLEDKIAEIAAARGQTVEMIRAYLEREKAFGVLEIRILEEKALDWLMERAEVVAAEAPPAPTAASAAVESPQTSE